MYNENSTPNIIANRVGVRSHGLRCAFAGYRTEKMRFTPSVNDPLYNDFRSRLRATIETLIDLGYGHFLSGGARGMDTWAADDVLELKYTHPEITLEMVAPYAAQSERWNDIDRKKHAELFTAADIVTTRYYCYQRGVHKVLHTRSCSAR